VRATRVAQISILHVDDSPAIARSVRETLETEGWRIELCTSGDTALRKLTGNEHYDALVFDRKLTGIDGFELIERARKITHRRRTPIIILSGENCEQAAWRAGANAFLPKPQGIDRLPATLKRLFKEFDRASETDDPQQI
jgi:DNA-binding response OmpR family regulator